MEALNVLNSKTFKLYKYGSYATFFPYGEISAKSSSPISYDTGAIHSTIFFLIIILINIFFS